jgi:hypothetical protein
MNKISCPEFDVTKYSLEELEQFFSLPLEYGLNDIKESSMSLKQTINESNMDVSDENVNMKKNLIYFIEKGSEILSKKLKNYMSSSNNEFVSPSNQKNVISKWNGSIVTECDSHFVMNKPNVAPLNDVSQVFPTNIATGVLNPLKRKTTMMTFALNTLFKDLDDCNASDCTITLPYVIKDVVSMRLSSIELPNSIYMIESYFNTIFIHEDETNLSFIVEINEGNYTPMELAEELTNKINSVFNSGDRFYCWFTPQSKRFYILNKVNTFSLYINTGDSKYYIYKSLGWLLGYRNRSQYEGQRSYIAESITNTNPTDYVYLEINEFNNSSTSNMIGIFMDYYLDKNIIAKVPYKNNEDVCGTQIINSQNIITSPRDYFGPIRLQKLKIRLLNQYGEVINLNYRDFSFTLDMEVLYQM